MLAVNLRRVMTYPCDRISPETAMLGPSTRASRFGLFRTPRPADLNPYFVRLPILRVFSVLISSWVAATKPTTHGCTRKARTSLFCL